MPIPSALVRRVGWAVALLLAAMVPGLAAPAAAGSLRFFGNGVGAPGKDRVTVPIAGSVNVGAGDFTLEWWMRTLPGDNPSTAATCGANDGWITGNIVLDRDIYGDGANASTFGDFGVSLSDGRVVFGVSKASGLATTGTTICGVTDVADGAWHHVAVVRHGGSGELRIYVDGILEAIGTGPAGNVSYQVGRATSFPDSDPFLVIGAEKHDAGASFPSYRGWIDEVRVSTSARYTAVTFTRPAAPFAPDGSTAALYHMDEGAGSAVGDASGGDNDGTRQVGGDPSGPAWSADEAPLGPDRRIALQAVSGLTGLSSPVAIAHAGDDRLFVVLQGGQIAVRQANGTRTTFLDIGPAAPSPSHRRVLAGGERGLLGLAFHPDHESNGYFYVYYTRSPDGALVIARYQTTAGDPDVADPDSETLLIDPPIAHGAHGNHNGGALAFGADRHLYAAVGDGGGAGDPDNNAQNLGTPLGKILRLDVHAAFPHAPATNPFPGPLPGSLIWAYGLRNPWRISFDRANDDFFIADVGQGSREEIDLQRATGDDGENGGRNYGWRRMEGFACFNPGSGCQTGTLVLPVLDYTHTNGRCSVTGGYRYRGAELPFLHGVYVFGDFCSGEIWGGVEGGGGAWARTDLLDTSLGISSFGEDAAGELYVADLYGGAVHRIVAAPPRLVVTRAGAGAGTVSGPGPIGCAPTCQADYAPGTEVTLTAAAGANSVFAGWSGSCAGTGSCVLTMSGDRAVTATFLPAPILRFSAASYAVGEGSSLGITVQRLLTTAGTVTVDYVIAGGSATPPPAAGADFGGPGGLLTGTLTFTPGQSTRSFTVTTGNDTRLEGPETVLLALTQPTGGATLGAPSTAVVTIVDNDTAGAIQFSQSEYRVSEARAGASLTVTRSGGASGVEVAWQITGGTAVAGVDFAGPTSGVLTFGPGTASVPLPITLLRQADRLADGPRTLLFLLSSPTPAGLATLGARTTATLLVTDDDAGGTLQFSPATLTASETAGTPVSVTVTRTGGAAGGVGVAWTVTGGTAVLGTDFTTPSGATGTLSFGPGATSQAIPLTLVNRPGAQGSRTVVLALGAPTGGAALGGAKTATLTITDDEIGLRFDTASFNASEASASATVTVVRTGPTAPPVTVDYASGPPASGVPAIPSGTPGACDTAADYRPVAGTLVFGAGQTRRAFTVPLCRDNVVDGEKRVGLTLANPGGGAFLGAPAAADLRLSEADTGGTIRFGSATATGSEGATVTLTVLRSGGSAGGVSVDYAITPVTATAPPAAGADYGAPAGGLSGTLTFVGGQSSRSLVVPLASDTLVESDETFQVTLSHVQGGAGLGAPSVATVRIVDTDRTGTVQFASATQSVHEFAPLVTLNVTRTGSSAGAASVDFTITGDTGAVTSPLAGTVSFAPGQGSRPLAIALSDDLGLDGNSQLAVTLSNPTGGLALGTPNPATVTLVDNESTVQFAASNLDVSEASGSVTVTVTRTGGTAQAVTVGVATGDPGDGATASTSAGGCSPGADYRPVAGTLSFSAGQTSRTFSVPLCGDSAVEGAELFTVTLSGPTLPAALGTPSTATVTILDNDVGGTAP